MKGAILAAGHGDQLKPFTDSISKPMIRILDKPLIEYALERLTKSGIREIYIVVGKNHNELKTYFKNRKSKGVLIHFVTQTQPGIDGAVLSLKGKFGSEEQFILTHSDIIVDPDIVSRTLNAADNTGSDMAIAVALQSELQEFGLVDLNSDGLVKKVIVNQEMESGNYVVAGSFLLMGKIFKYMGNNTPFNESFNKFISDGGTVAGGIWNNPWIDVGRSWDILRATWYEIGKLKHSIISKNAIIEHNVEIKGPVIIEDGAQILNGAIIKGPAYIGKNAFIGNNSLVRECSVIERSAKIGMGVEVRSSVIMKGASIARLSYIGASIIGENATFHSGALTINSRRPHAPIKTVIEGVEVTVPLEKFGAIVGSNSHIGEHSSLYPGTRVDSNAIVPPNTAVGGHIKSDN